MGNPHQLTARATGTAADARNSGKPATKPWLRPVLYGAGTVSMLMISMASSLSLWIALPWGFLGWSPTLVTSGSMEPLVTPGDVVMIRPVGADELVPNTVILFERADGERVLHRIVEQLPDGTFRTQGDANAVPDSEFLHAEKIQGAAVLTQRYAEERSWTLETYERTEGYVAWRRALTMTPDELVTLVKDSGLRGRGGAGRSP